jgi:putative transposase
MERPFGADGLYVGIETLGAEITCIPDVGRVRYVAVVLDAWPWTIFGYATSPSVDARLTVAALEPPIERRRLPANCAM